MSDLFGMEDGSILQTHPEGLCAGETCCIHNPSNHSLNNQPLSWDPHTVTMYRICPCGTPHPDPDHIIHVTKRFGVALALLQQLHGCCPKNCCEG